MAKKLANRQSQKGPQPCIKIYTTADVVKAFARRASGQNRSVSKHGEFLVKQDLGAFAGRANRVA